MGTSSRATVKPTDIVESEDGVESLHSEIEAARLCRRDGHSSADGQAGLHECGQWRADAAGSSSLTRTTTYNRVALNQACDRPRDPDDDFAVTAIKITQAEQAAEISLVSRA